MEDGSRSTLLTQEAVEVAEVAVEVRCAISCK
jgi:hypothetical protein